MRKVLFIIAIVLMLVLGYVSVVNGIEIGNLKVLSIKQVDEQSKELKQKIEELNSLIDVNYPKKISELKEANNKMQSTKEEYLKETNVSTDEEILYATQTQSYDIERLWTTIGKHVNDAGVILKLVLNASSSGSNETKDIAFTVDGTYIAITNFIYAIEDDEELNFRIYNFQLSPYQNDILRATFTVRDVRITSSSLNENLTSSTTTTDTSTNEANNSANQNTNNNTSAQNNTNTNTTTQNTTNQ